jgi:hypothetical protein
MELALANVPTTTKFEEVEENYDNLKPVLRGI